MAGRIPIKPGTMPNVSAKPKFPMGAQPRDYPRINNHPTLVGGGSSTKPQIGRDYGKSMKSGANVFGSLGGT